MAITLIESILAKCQRERWYGPDYYNPRRFDGFPDDEGNLPVRVVDSKQDVSRHLLTDPERIGFAYAKATPAQVATSEQRLGFALPPILRDLYQRLANGGFGPGTGLRGIAGGYPGANSEGTILDLYPIAAPTSQLFDLAPEQQEWLVLPEGQWPRRVLCLADLGCVQEACVDTGSSRMYLCVVTEEDRHALVSLPWTLETWLWRWVHGEHLISISAGAA